MRLKLYRAESVAKAMAQMRAELGPEALMVATRRVADGVELTAALDLADEEPAPLPRPVPPPHAATGLDYHSIPERLLAGLNQADEPMALAAALARTVRFAPLPLDNASRGAHCRPLLVAGLPGAGKTLTVARLATRMVLSGLAPMVITADGRRAGAPEELASYTRLLGLKLLVADTPALVMRALASVADQVGPAGPVLIDTSGIDPFEADDIAALAGLAQAADAVPVLVMAAGLHPQEAAEQAQAFAPLGVVHLLATRLDLVRRLGSILAAADAGNLALTEAGIGPGIAGTLVPITPEFLAHRLLHPASRLATTPVLPLPQSRTSLRPPVFPTIRAQAARAWSNGSHG